MTTTHEPVSPVEYIALDHISWKTYLALRRDTDEQHLFITYDEGRMVIDRRGADVGALENVSWETYQRLLRELQHRRFQLTYDNGSLTIVSPSHLHDRVKTLMGRMIELLSLEWGVSVVSLGSATWVREDVWKGLESDECYYVQNALRVRGKDQLDLSVDPPPDLAVEVEVSHQPVDRLRLYAALGVGEVWHWRRERINPLKLQGAAYVPIDFSVAFPSFRPKDLERFLAMRHTMDDTGLMQAFQQWVRTLPRP